MGEQVPRLVHLVWLGSAVPARVERLRADIARHDPDVEVRIWGDGDLTWLQNHDALLAEPRMSAKADIARFEILQRHGGIYLDADFRLHRSLAPVFAAIDRHGLVAARQSPTVYNCAFIGARAGHPLLDDLVAAIPGTYRWTGRMTAPATTGPHFFTERLLAHVRAGGSFHELPQHAVFPWYADEDPLPAGVLPASVVMSHEWATISGGWSWGDVSDEYLAVTVPDRRSRTGRSGGSLRARAATTPAAHRAVARLERLRDRVPGLRPAIDGDPSTTTEVHVEGWAARHAARALRGSAAFLDLHPASCVPSLAAATSLDRPGRVLVVLDEPRAGTVPAALLDPSIRCSVHVIGTRTGDPDAVALLRSRGTPLVARDVSSSEPPLEHTAAPRDQDLPGLLGAVPRFDLVRVRAERLTPDVATTLGAMTAERRVARLLVTIDPFAVAPGLTHALAAIERLELQGLTTSLAPWLVDGRGRTWREHLRVAARPFMVAVGA